MNVSNAQRLSGTIKENEKLTAADCLSCTHWAWRQWKLSLSSLRKHRSFFIYRFGWADFFEFVKHTKHNRENEICIIRHMRAAEDLV